MLTVTIKEKTLRAAAKDTPAFIREKSINIDASAHIHHLCAFNKNGELVGAAVLDPEAFDITAEVIADHLGIEVGEFEVAE